MQETAENKSSMWKAGVESFNKAPTRPCCLAESALVALQHHYANKG